MASTFKDIPIYKTVFCRTAKFYSLGAGQHWNEASKAYAPLILIEEQLSGSYILFGIDKGKIVFRFRLTNKCWFNKMSNFFGHLKNAAWHINIGLAFPPDGSMLIFEAKLDEINRRLLTPLQFRTIMKPCNDVVSQEVYDPIANIVESGLAKERFIIIKPKPDPLTQLLLKNLAKDDNGRPRKPVAEVFADTQNSYAIDETQFRGRNKKPGTIYAATSSQATDLPKNGHPLFFINGSQYMQSQNSNPSPGDVLKTSVPKTVRHNGSDPDSAPWFIRTTLAAYDRFPQLKRPQRNPKSNQPQGPSHDDGYLTVEPIKTSNNTLPLIKKPQGMSIDRDIDRDIVQQQQKVPGPNQQQSSSKPNGSLATKVTKDSAYFINGTPFLRQKQKIPGSKYRQTSSPPNVVSLADPTMYSMGLRPFDTNSSSIPTDPIMYSIDGTPLEKKKILKPVKPKTSKHLSGAFI